MTQQNAVLPTEHPLGEGTEAGDPITVYVVDDHDVVRKGLSFYLNAHPDITIVGEAGDAQSAVKGVTCFNTPRAFEKASNPKKPWPFPMPLLFEPPKGR